MWTWEAFHAINYLAALIGVAVQDQEPPHARPAAVVMLIAAAAWYWFLGHRSLAAETATTRRGIWCVAGVSVFFAAAIWFSGAASWATPAIISQTFWLLPLRFSAPVVALLNFLPAILALAKGVEPGTVFEEMVPGGIIFCALSLLIGYDVNKVTDQNTAQADLIERLEASQAEVARLSHEAGTAGERERLAREIHDTLAQGFTSIVTLTQAIESELDSDPPSARRHLDLAARTARENLDEARAMVEALTPSALAPGSLADAIRRQVDAFSEETGVTVGCEFPAVLPKLATATEVVLLRAAQEALANVRRHAEASNVFVSLSGADGRVRLTVRDDGVGFAGREGFGLRGMRARAEEIGGTLEVRAGSEAGTALELEVPAR